MKWLTLLIPAGILVVNISVLQADTIHVPSQQPTIQAGIDVAVDGDTVLVADGTYTGDGNRDIDFFGKAIVVMSENGAENCVIDCQADSLNHHRGFYFHSGEDTSSVVQGFTITNGRAEYNGSGIYCSHSSPAIRKNIITANETLAGGGIFLAYESNALIENNVISNNHAYGDDRSRGGGIYMYGDCFPIIDGNTITGNTAEEKGGGIFCRFSCSPLITNNSIVGNTAQDGGGISLWNDCSPHIAGNNISGNVANSLGGAISCSYFSSPTIDNNIITSNTAGTRGGAIRIFYGSLSITNSIIMKNSAHDIGGGIFCFDIDLYITNSIISENTTDTNGGGIYVDWCNIRDVRISNTEIARNTAGSSGGGIYSYNASHPIFTSTTFKGNSAQYRGGAVCSEDHSSPIITNCILWGDSPDEIYDDSGNPPVTYSDIQGGWPGEGNINEDPMFALPDKDDYRLLWESPCIDTGHPDSLDADGTRSDMGAHYFNQNDYLTLYMTPDTTEVAQGGQMGVTYTIINRWQQKEPFSALTRVTLPDGEVRTILGPEDYDICPGYTFQNHITYPIPPCAYLGMYEYQGAIGVPPSTLYDDDSFKFWVVE